LSSGEGQYPIHAAALLIGEDLLVAMWGGTHPHIGAVSLAQPRPSIADPERTSATASVLTRLGHKDDEVAKMVSERLAASLAKNVVVTVGIHWNHLDQEGIEEIVANCRELAETLSARVKSEIRNPKSEIGNRKSLVVGISGASGAIYGIRLLQALRETEVESHLIVTEAAKRIIRLETPFTVEQVEALADHVYANDDLSAAISSGSFPTLGMVVIPCSVKSLSAIANSYSANLLVRAADVTLKERRPLVVVVRETPLHRGHLESMLRLTDMGAVILPPVPAFYHSPRTIEDLVDHTVGKVFDLFGIEHALFTCWKGIDNGGKT